MQLLEMTLPDVAFASVLCPHRGRFSLGEPVSASSRIWSEAHAALDAGPAGKPSVSVAWTRLSRLQAGHLAFLSCGRRLDMLVCLDRIRELTHSFIVRLQRKVVETPPSFKSQARPWLVWLSG